MKFLSKLFGIIGAIRNVGGLLVSLFLMIAGGIAAKEGTGDTGAIVAPILIGILVFLPFIFMTILVTRKIFRSFRENRKDIGFGICDIIFVSPLSGIFYLLWHPTM